MSFSRRDFIALIGTSVAGAAALAAGNKLAKGSSANAQAAGVAADNSAAAEDNWTVQAVGAVQKGAVAITLVHNATNEHVVLDACRRSLSAKQDGREAVASSKKFDLFLANQGDGHKQTPRQHVIAARALARHLDQIGVSAPEPLLTMNARLARHGELFDTNDDAIG